MGKGGETEESGISYRNRGKKKKSDIPLPTGCWFAILNIDIAFLIFYHIFNTGSSQYCFCAIAWLSNATPSKKFWYDVDNQPLLTKHCLHSLCLSLLN